MSIPGIFFVYSPLLMCLSLICTGLPFVTGQFINSLVYQQSAFVTFAVLACALLLKSLMTPVLSWYVCKQSRSLEIGLQMRVLDEIMKLHPSRLSILENGEIVAKLTRDAYAVGGFVRGLYPRMIQSIIVMLGAGCVLYARSALLAIVFAAIFPITVLLFMPFTHKFSDNSSRVRKQSDISFNALFDFLQALPTLSLLDAEQRFANEPRTALTDLKGSNGATDNISINFGFCLGILMVGGEITVLGIAGSFAVKGMIPIGDVVVYQMLFITAIQTVEGIIGLLPEISALREGVDSLCEVFTGCTTSARGVRIDTFDNLTFDHVSFFYAKCEQNIVIKDFSAIFRVGSVVGFSGVNGAGKSTLLKLAVNALEPMEGVVSLNGYTYADIDLAAFRRRIGIVFQDNPIITGTVRDNITLRDPSFTLEDIERALHLSGFWDVVNHLPNGLATHIDNRSCRLSGGERQKLAIARAIIRNPIILILDEVTNHLDAESRNDVVELISRLRDGRLILIADHDEQLNDLCDQHISLQRTGALCI